MEGLLSTGPTPSSFANIFMFRSRSELHSTLTNLAQLELARAEIGNKLCSI